MIPQYVFLFLVQMLNLVYQISSLRTLRSIARQDQLQQERVKAWLLILLDIAVMVCVVLSDPTLPHSPIPRSTMIVTSFLAVLDMIRLGTLLQLQTIKWVCFAVLEVDHFLRAPEMTLFQAGKDVMHAAAFGAVVPLALAAVSEAYQRETFLRDCRKPMSALDPFWSSLLRFMRKFPGLGGELPPQHPHID